MIPITQNENGGTGATGVNVTVSGGGWEETDYNEAVRRSMSGSNDEPIKAITAASFNVHNLEDRTKVEFKEEDRKSVV